MSNQKPELYIVFPCYNEEACLETTISVVQDELETLIQDGVIKSGKMLFVNDGSADNTWNIIKKHSDNPFVSGISLSGNRGHQAAMIAGLETVYSKTNADIVITMDADLQDDVHSLREMVNKYKSGCNIVYTARNDRSTDSFFKRTTALGFYKAMNLLGVKTIYNSADFRLLDRKALKCLFECKENAVFLRSLIPYIGLKSDVVYFERQRRIEGTTKFSFSKMVDLARNGIISSTNKPLSINWVFALFCFIIAVIRTFQKEKDASVFLVGSVVTAGMAVNGEYLGNVYRECKGRPRYFVSETTLEE